MIEVILIGVVVILVMGIMVQSRFTELEKKVDKQFQLSRENKETLDNIRTEQNWLSADLRGEVEEVLDMVKNKENKD
jgi:sensor domain CHASE-containing protein